MAADTQRGPPPSPGPEEWSWPSALPITIRQLVLREVSRRYLMLAHAHNLWQWYAPLAGDILATIDGREHLLQTGRSLLIPPGASRAFRTHRGTPSYLFALFSPSAALHLPRHGDPITHAPELRPDLRALAQLLSDPAGNTALAAVLCARLVLGLHDGSSKPASGIPVATGPTHTAFACRLDEVLTRALDHHWRRDDLARALHCSPSQLTRTYRAATGSTPFVRLNDLRLQRARQLLRDSTLSISQIALEIGFTSFSHFSQAFHRSAGMTPTAYRNIHGETW